MTTSENTSAPEPIKRNAVSGMLLLAADLMTMLYAGCVYFAAFSGPVWILCRLRYDNPLLLVGTAIIGWYAAAFVFSTLLILTKKLVIGPVPLGRYRLTGNRVGRWIAAARLMKIMLRSPFRMLLAEDGFLRLFFYRGMGAKINATTLMGNGAKFPEPWAVKIGRNVMIGDGAVLSGHKVEHHVVTLGPVEVGDDVLIGAGSIIFPDVKIGSGATIGAGSVVPRGTVISPGETWAGNPAVKMTARRPVFDAAIKHQQPEESAAR